MFTQKLETARRKGVCMVGLDPVSLLCANKRRGLPQKILSNNKRAETGPVPIILQVTCVRSVVQMCFVVTQAVISR